MEPLWRGFHGFLWVFHKIARPLFWEKEEAALRFLNAPVGMCVKKCPAHPGSSNFRPVVGQNTSRVWMKHLNFKTRKKTQQPLLLDHLFDHSESLGSSLTDSGHWQREIFAAEFRAKGAIYTNYLTDWTENRKKLWHQKKMFDFSYIHSMHNYLHFSHYSWWNQVCSLFACGFCILFELKSQGL
jgi:hypothetical protein